MFRHISDIINNHIKIDMHTNLQMIYKNYRGEISRRTVRPISIRFGSTEWHPEPQWLMLAFDLDKNAEREFAMTDIQSFGARG